MGKVKNKVYDWKDRLRDRKMLTLVVTLVAIILTLTVYTLKLSKDFRQLADNSYNEAFYELIEHVNNTEKLLAKSMISNSDEHAARILSHISQTAVLAQSYLARIPIEAQDLENTQKFLNQVGDYCYVLSKKAIDQEKLNDEDLQKLKELHTHSIELEDTLNQLEQDLFQGNIRWGELQKKGTAAVMQNDNNISKLTFSNIEENLHQYTGLIYDGAFSENQSNFKGEGLTGNDIDEENAKDIAKKFIGEDKIKELTPSGEIENGRIQCYSFSGVLTNDANISISVSKKGGHVVAMNSSRDIKEQSISKEEAIKSGKDFLEQREYKNMKETYYMEEGNAITINYAFTQEINAKGDNTNGEIKVDLNNVIIYPDLIKVKVALDNGEVLGIEATNYLNSHKEKRELKDIKITPKEALDLINKNLEIKQLDIAIIPTEWNSEILCYEIKGRTGENDFLVYINAQSGKEEDILMIVDTPNGTLTT